MTKGTTTPQTAEDDVVVALLHRIERAQRRQFRIAFLVAILGIAVTIPPYFGFTEKLNRERALQEQAIESIYWGEIRGDGTGSWITDSVDWIWKSPYRWADVFAFDADAGPPSDGNVQCQEGQAGYADYMMGVCDILPRRTDPPQ